MTNDPDHSNKPKWSETRPGVVIVDFSPTDPRSAVPIGGIRLGQDFKFVLSDEMPRLSVPAVIKASENIVRGSECYTSLLYLSRARVEDTKTVFMATQSPDIRQRWERLWVLSPFFSRLARHPEAQTILLECMKDDLAAVHLLSKFAEQKNNSVKRLFERLHDGLLDILLEHLVQYQHDFRRTSLLSSIISVIEKNPSVLRAILSKHAKADVIDELLLLLHTKAGQGMSRLSAQVLRHKLQNMGED